VLIPSACTSSQSTMMAAGSLSSKSARLLVPFLHPKMPAASKAPKV
jgi:hypothetical protein